MERIAKFEKVSYEQFSSDWKALFSDTAEDKIHEIYSGISLPKRATVGSAGYDFFLPAELSLAAGESSVIPTGIRAKISEGWVLNLYPRSGLGFKFRLQLDNTVGIIDSDYYNSTNEGHIIAKITNDGKSGRTLFLEAGKSFIQGVFLPFGITVDDTADGERVGGFGSTG